MPEPIPIKDHEKENRLVNKRLLACALLVIGITCALVGRMYFLQVVQYDYHSTMYRRCYCRVSYWVGGAHTDKVALSFDRSCGVCSSRAGMSF